MFILRPDPDRVFFKIRLGPSDKCCDNPTLFFSIEQEIVREIIDVKLNISYSLLPGQSMVNIGGRKFLVIPRPPMELDSPPPSPPAPSSAAERGGRGEKLPVWLEPADRRGEDDNTPR